MDNDDEDYEALSYLEREQAIISSLQVEIFEQKILFDALLADSCQGEWQINYPESCITKREDNVVYVDFK